MFEICSYRESRIIRVGARSGRVRLLFEHLGSLGDLGRTVRPGRGHPATQGFHGCPVVGILRRSDANLPKVFGILPKIPYELKEMEKFRCEAAPEAYYYNAPDDGSRPAYFYVNTCKPETRPIYTMEALAYHEAQPGHHFQLALAQQRKDWPMFRRFESINAFIEGWAHYSEQLMVEQGFGKKDPLVRLGQLSEALIRIVRLIVGIKLHAEDLSVEQGVRLFREEAYLEESSARREAERGTFDPSYVVYALGRLMLLKLRRDAQNEAGENFSLQAFHDKLLGNGLLPFPAHRRLMLRDASGPLLG